MLAETSEASISSIGAQSLSAVEPWNWDAVKEEREDQTEDGETVHYTVYDFSGSASDEGQQGLGAQGQEDETDAGETATGEEQQDAVGEQDAAGQQVGAGQQDTAGQIDILATSDGTLQAQVEEPAEPNPEGATAEQHQAEQAQVAPTQAEQAQPDATHSSSWQYYPQARL